MSESHTQQFSRINDALYHIHQDISQTLSAKELATIAAYSEQHFHRVFKEIVGESVHRYVRRCRLEYAANQLMFDLQSSVLEVACRSGFSNASSFSKAFMQYFALSPKAWRETNKQRIEKPYLSDPEISACFQKFMQKKQTLVTPEIIDIPDRKVAYIRHVGYNRSIKKTWQLLNAWARSEGRDFTTQFGLYHSNPSWIELNKCQYVACVEIDKPLNQRSIVNQLTIPGGLYAKFSLVGKYGELLPQMTHILENWLPYSGFKMKSIPSYVQYQKNQFIDKDEAFELDYFIPISFY